MAPVRMVRKSVSAEPRMKIEAKKMTMIRSTFMVWRLVGLLGFRSFTSRSQVVHKSLCFFVCLPIKRKRYVPTGRGCPQDVQEAVGRS